MQAFDVVNYNTEIHGEDTEAHGGTRRLKIYKEILCDIL
jgi:hypothetical protein